MKFRIVAFDKQGTEKVMEIESESDTVALAYMKKQGLSVAEIKLVTEFVPPPPPKLAPGDAAELMEQKYLSGGEKSTMNFVGVITIIAAISGLYNILMLIAAMVGGVVMATIRLRATMRCCTAKLLEKLENQEPTKKI